MQSVNFEEEVEKIVGQDKRYHRDAYYFVREALDYTQQKLRRSEKTHPETPHVTGQELLRGIRDYALERYGPMAITVLYEWGIKRCEDFGDIVFNLVEGRILNKRDEDSREDFKGGYDFEDAFRKPFLPPSTATKSSPEIKPG